MSSHICTLCNSCHNDGYAWELHLESAEHLRNKIAADRAELLAALKAITERAEDVSQRITVENRSEGVSQAAHVRHMASHLAQHAKIARAAISKAEA